MYPRSLKRSSRLSASAGAVLIVAITAVQPVAAQQTVAPAVSPTVIPPVGPSTPASPATPVTPLARGGTTPAPIVPPEQIAPASPVGGSALNPAMSGGANATPLSGPPVDPIPGRNGKP